MKMSTRFTQLALAGIASGMIVGTISAGEMGDMNMSTKMDSSAHAKPAKGKKAHKVKAAATDSASMPMASPDSSVTKTTAQGCRGHNTCKGMGNCAVSEKVLKELAAKAGIPMEKAGKPHGCKGMNECKGLGGCKS
jgi:hypothetical protein